jgi:hypothetical protein
MAWEVSETHAAAKLRKANWRWVFMGCRKLGNMSLFEVMASVAFKKRVGIS